MCPATRRAQVIVEPCVDPRLVVVPAPVGIDVRGPCHREGVHPVFILELVCSVEAVFTTGPGHKAVVVAVIAPIAIAQLTELTIARCPVDLCLLPFGDSARVTNAIAVESDGQLLAIDRMLELNCGVGALVRDHAPLAELDLSGQSVVCVKLCVGDVRVHLCALLHCNARNRRTMDSPTSPLFSGWNWQPVTLSRRMDADTRKPE